MKNGLGQIQNVLVLGSTSEIANAIVDNLLLSSDGNVIRLGLSSTSDFFLDLSKPLDAFGLSEFLSGQDLDLVIIASGILGGTPADMSLEEIDSMLKINFSNAVIFLSLLSAILKKQGHGSILVISSVAGLRPRQSNYIYGASKSGLDFYARGLANELHECGICVSILRPGFVKSKMTLGLKPAPFALDPKRVAQIAIAGLTKKKRIIYAPGILKFVFIVIKFLPQKIFSKLE
jgi:decaprenylphospho-beta-D-erythro-pentofuranosid-2-ulose 2-reductase